MDISLPFGNDSIVLSLDNITDFEILEPNISRNPTLNKEFAIKKAILNPISSDKISNLVDKNDKVAIVMTDIARKLPEDIILKVLHEELRKAGVKEENVTIVVATGTHRKNTFEEILDMYGDEIHYFKVVNHNAYDNSDLVYLGETKSGIPVWINKYVAQADFIITTGVIEPHLFAGYSGGIKTVSVGTAGIDTIGATHNYRTLSDNRVRLGQINGNIFRDYLNEINEKVGVDFIINVIQDGEKNLKGVVAGHPYKAFEDGVKLAKPMYECSVDGQADIIVTCPGYPKSRDLYQATRVWNTIMFGPKEIIKTGGTIIIPCSCEDGVGHDDFKEQLSDSNNIESLLAYIHDNGFNPGEHKSFVAARVLRHANVAITNCLIDRHTINKMKMECFEDLNMALNEIKSRYINPKIYIIPYGIITLPLIKC